MQQVLVPSDKPKRLSTKREPPPIFIYMKETKYIWLVDAEGSILELDSVNTRLLNETDFRLDPFSARVPIHASYYRTIRRVFPKMEGKKGIKILYGKTAEETIPFLRQGIKRLPGEASNSRWEDTDGNVKADLEKVLSLALECPNGIWAGEY